MWAEHLGVVERPALLDRCEADVRLSCPAGAQHDVEETEATPVGTGAPTLDTADRKPLLRQPGPWPVLVVAQQAGEEADTDGDAERASESRCEGRGAYGAAEVRPPLRSAG